MCVESKKITSINNGKIFVVSAPSGTGKTVLCRVVCKNLQKLVYSISHTTRLPRKGEIEGKDYYFISKKKFLFKIKSGELVEWAIVYGNYYGTSIACLKKYLNEGKNVLLDLDIYGTKKILKKYPNAITIFIMPPSLKILRNRLRKRATDDLNNIHTRLLSARSEIRNRVFYKNIIINDIFDEAVNIFINIIQDK